MSTLISKALHNKAIRDISVIGFGQMGQGIAQVSAMTGYRVRILDQNIDKLKEGHTSIYRQVESYATKNISLEKDEDATYLKTKRQQFIDETMARIVVCDTLLDSIQGTDLIIETIAEDLDAKMELFTKLGHNEEVIDSIIFASNTSSFKIETLANASKIFDRTVGLHFFNPVPKMKLVELVTLNKTKPEVVDALKDYILTIGKTPVLCKDSPGFIVNRLLVPYLFEAIRLAESEIASIQDIDLAMKLGAGHPMGPFTLLDFVGLDTVKSIMDGWHHNEPLNPSYYPSNLLNCLVKEGKLGKKSGEGFFKYENEK